MAESDDLRAFIRDLMARFDRGMDATMVRLDRQHSEFMARLDREHNDFMAGLEEKERADVRRHKAVMARIAEDRERLDDILAENRAQRAALFRMLDKLDGRGGEAPG